MSTKIFPHIPRKIKPPKPPDPSLDAMFEAAQEERKRQEAQRAEERRIMAQLRAEELEKRAAKLQPRENRMGKVYCCSRCWAIDRGQIMFSKRKNLFRIWRAVENNRPEILGDPWLYKARLELGKELIKAARLEGVEIDGEEMADYVILISNKVIAMGKETFEEAHPEKTAIKVATIHHPEPD